MLKSLTCFEKSKKVHRLKAQCKGTCKGPCMEGVGDIHQQMMQLETQKISGVHVVTKYETNYNVE